MIDTEKLLLTPMKLRTLIMNAVKDLVGVYALPGASTFSPAIAVLPDKVHGENYPPPETTISGIEIVIHRPRPNASHRLGTDVMRVRKWEIYINQWDGNGELNTVVDKMLDAFQDNYLRFTPPVFPEYNLAIGIVPYCRIAITENVLRVIDKDDNIVL